MNVIAVEPTTSIPANPPCLCGGFFRYVYHVWWKCPDCNAWKERGV